MGGPTSSYATAGIALRVSGALKSHHHDKMEAPSVGQLENTYKILVCIPEARSCFGDLGIDGMIILKLLFHVSGVP
jgi:hypothetical protein